MTYLLFVLASVITPPTTANAQFEPIAMVIEEHDLKSCEEDARRIKTKMPEAAVWYCVPKDSGHRYE
jgi:hypothetical protein